MVTCHGEQLLILGRSINLNNRGFFFLRFYFNLHKGAMLWIVQSGHWSLLHGPTNWWQLRLRTSLSFNLHKKRLFASVTFVRSKMVMSCTCPITNGHYWLLVDFRADRARTIFYYPIESDKFNCDHRGLIELFIDRNIWAVFSCIVFAFYICLIPS